MLYINQHSAIIYSGYKAISLLPFLSEKHICILFLSTILISDSGMKRDTLLDII